MIVPLASTFGVGVASALVPVINMELYVVGLLLAKPDVPAVLVGIIAAVGQMVGKAAFYCAGRGSVRLGARLRRKTDAQRTGKWSARLAKFQDNCQRHPTRAGGILLLSATVGLPPFAIMAFTAGAGRISPTLFATTGLLGRAVRFTVLATAPQLVPWFA